MKKIVYSAEAVENLKKIYDHVEENFSEDKAKNIVLSILEKISSLEKFPQVGKISTLSALVRELVIEGNTVFYQITEETIDIVFIKPRKTKKLS
jgi:plasmid stabilization system protein ParE